MLDLNSTPEEFLEPISRVIQAARLVDALTRGITEPPSGGRFNQGGVEK